MRLYSPLTGHWIEIDETCVLGAGGEGRVYGVSGAPSLAAKLFDHAGRPERDDKLRAMLSNAPTAPSPHGHSSIAWPQDLLSEAPGGHVAGYIMPRVWNGRVIDDYYNPQARLDQCPLFHYEYLVVVARNLAAAVRSLHQRDYVVGDIKQSNILVTPNALVTLVDTDSFQVRDAHSGSIHRCPVGTAEYTPPELQGLKTPGLLTPEHDLFGLGVLLFQLLMEGAHPFAGVYTGEEDPPPVGDRIRMGWFPYDNPPRPLDESAATFRRQQELRAVAPPPFVPARKALPFHVLPPELRALFLRCFAEGRHNSMCRPTAEEWQQALDRTRAKLVRCSANSQHRYGDHLGTCPWCERMRTVLRGHDPYPAIEEIDRRNAPPAPLFAGAWRQTPATPVELQPLPPSPRPAHRPQSGWAAYALAALGVPVVLGILSSQEARHTPRQPLFFDHIAPSSSPAYFDPDSVTTPSIPSDTPRTPAVPGVTALQSLSPGGQFAAVIRDPTSISLFDCRSGRCLGRVEPSGGRAAIDSAAISPSGLFVATSDRYGVSLWDREKSFSRTVLPDCGTVRSLAFSPSGDSLAVASGRGDDLVALLDGGTGAFIRGFSGNYGEMVTTVRFSPNGTHLFASTVGSADEATTLYCWDAHTGDLVWRLGKKSWNTRFAVSPDGKSLAVGGWELDLRNAINGDEQEQGVVTGEVVPDADPLCYSHDGRMLAVGCPASLRLYRFVSGGEFASTLPVVQVVAAAFSTDGARLTTLSWVNGLEEWDVKHQRRIRRLSLSAGSR